MKYQIIESPRGWRRAFSLIELLLSIVIISVLVALVTVGLRNAKAGSRDAKCAANLRAIGVATQLYVQDNNGCLPFGAYQNLRPGFLYWPTWEDLLVAYKSPGATPFMNDADYAGFYCAEAPAGSPVATTFLNSGYHATYAYNAYILRVSGEGTGWKASAIRRPSNTLMLVCGDETAALWSSSTKPGFSHRGKTFVLFFDGHAKKMTESEIKNDVEPLRWPIDAD